MSLILTVMHSMLLWWALTTHPSFISRDLCKMQTWSRHSAFKLVNSCRTRCRLTVETNSNSSGPLPHTLPTNNCIKLLSFPQQIPFGPHRFHCFSCPDILIIFKTILFCLGNTDSSCMTHNTSSPGNRPSSLLAGTSSSQMSHSCASIIKVLRAAQMLVFTFKLGTPRELRL